MGKKAVVGLYKSETEVQNAIKELLASDFSRDRIFTKTDPEKSQYMIDSSGTLVGSDSIGRSLMEETGIGEFFRALVGKDDEKNRANAYTHAVSEGHIILQVNANTDEEADRASQIMNSYDLIDIDEYSLSLSNRMEGEAGMTTVPSYLQRGATEVVTGGASETSASSRPSGTAMSADSAESDMAGLPPNVDDNIEVTREFDDLQKGKPKDQRASAQQPMSSQGAGGMMSSPASGISGAGVSSTTSTPSDAERSSTMTRPTETDRSTTRQSAETRMSGGAHNIPEDAEFQSHWQHSYWTSGGSYDDYAPAYRYGADYADNDTNPNHQWADVEMRLRNEWEAYNSQETNSWEKNKDAILYGWENGRQRGRGSRPGESLG